MAFTGFGENTASDSNPMMDSGHLNTLLKMLGIGGGLGSTAMGIMDMRNAGKNNPSNSANPFLNEIEPTLTRYSKPYVDAGTNMIPGLTSEYESMTKNPGDLYSRIASGYKQSPGYKYKLKTAMDAATAAQAAGGMLGTPQHQQVNMETAEGVASKDFEDFLTHVLGLHREGIEGERNMFNTGATSSSNLAESLSNALSQKAQNAYTGQANVNQAKSQGRSNIFSGLSHILPFLFA